MKLSATQKETYDMMKEKGLNPRQIAERRRISIQAVYKVLNTLRKKGLLDRKFQVIRMGGVTQNHLNSHHIRLHFNHVHIKPYYYGRTYQEKIKRANMVKYQDTTLCLYRHAIELYDSTQFLADSADDAEMRYMEHLMVLLREIEKDYDVGIIKHRKQNIKIVRQHYSETDNEIAKEYERKDRILRVKASEDGKTWLLVDNSENWHELETLHPETAKNDNQRVVSFLNDIRDNDAPNISEVLRIIVENNAQVMGIIKNLAEQNVQTATGLNAVVKLINLGLNQNQKQEPQQEVPKDKPEYMG